MSKWISVEERKPYEGEAIDIWDPHQGRVPDCYVEDGEVISTYMMWSGTFTHFMPVPGPPED